MRSPFYQMWKEDNGKRYVVKEWFRGGEAYYRGELQDQRRKMENHQLPAQKDDSGRSRERPGSVCRKKRPGKAPSGGAGLNDAGWEEPVCGDSSFQRIIMKN